MMKFEFDTRLQRDLTNDLVYRAVLEGATSPPEVSAAKGINQNIVCARIRYLESCGVVKITHRAFGPYMRFNKSVGNKSCPHPANVSGQRANLP